MNPTVHLKRVSRLSGGLFHTAQSATPRQSYTRWPAALVLKLFCTDKSRIMYGHTHSKCMDQPGKVANPARGQLNREEKENPCSRSCLGIWSRETSSAVPSRISLLISILRLNLVRTYGIPPEFRGGVHLFV